MAYKARNGYPRTIGFEELMHFMKQRGGVVPPSGRRLPLACTGHLARRACNSSQHLKKSILFPAQRFIVEHLKWLHYIRGCGSKQSLTKPEPKMPWSYI